MRSRIAAMGAIAIAVLALAAPAEAAKAPAGSVTVRAECGMDIPSTYKPEYRAVFVNFKQTLGCSSGISIERKNVTVSMHGHELVYIPNDPKTAPRDEPPPPVPVGIAVNASKVEIVGNKAPKSDPIGGQRSGPDSQGLIDGFTNGLVIDPEGASYGIKVHDITVDGSSADGIIVGGYAELSNLTVAFSRANGIESVGFGGPTFEKVLVLGSDGDGIRLGSYAFESVVDSIVKSNGGSGIYSDPNVGVSAAPKVSGTKAIYNQDWGIYLRRGSSGSDNRAFGNGQPQQCKYVECN